MSNIAIISDLHIGLNARAKDFCPNDIESKGSDENYKLKFIEYVKKNSIKADFLVVSGDISDCGNPNEVQLGSQLILEMSKALGVNNRNIIIVPGNHDIDWHVHDAKDKTGLRVKQRYDAFKMKNVIFNKIMSGRSGSLLENNYFKIWEIGSSLFVGYNSASHDREDLSIHNGHAFEKHINELDRALGRLSLGNKTKIFVTHHHPVQYSERVPDTTDLSILTNAENLLRVLAKYKFDIFIHGHKHFPNSKIEIICGHSIFTFCAGSFSRLLSSSWSGHVNNQFHILEIHGRESETQTLMGVVKSWTFLCGKGWIPSKPHNGARHKLYFGPYTSPALLKKRIIDFIDQYDPSKNYIEWKNIIDAEDVLKHTQYEVILSIVNELCAEGCLKFYGEEEPDKLLLVVGV
jgi:metallophosphoesterase superfamily enzyme